ncbi:hypothetical protein LINPERPRIM_LOCUS34638 [Linum perenne]
MDWNPNLNQFLYLLRFIALFCGSMMRDCDDETFGMGGFRKIYHQIWRLNLVVLSHMKVCGLPRDNVKRYHGTRVQIPEKAR